MAGPDLAAWLLEQLAEDRQIREEQGETHTLDCMARVSTEWDHQCRCGFAHRVEAECDAKRQVIEAVKRREQGHPGRHANIIGEGPEAYDEYDSCAYCIRWNETTLQPYVLRLLALPYSDRAGYREEWKP
jgi:hypothetical protein